MCLHQNKNKVFTKFATLFSKQSKNLQFQVKEHGMKRLPTKQKKL